LAIGICRVKKLDKYKILLTL